MSFETFFDVWPNCLLALPTAFAADFTSRSDRPDFAIARGTGMPSTFLRRGRLVRITPPTIPAVAAPTATAGPLSLPAASLIVPTTPPADLAARPLELWRLRFAVVAAERDDPLLERDRALRARAAFAFAPGPFAEALLLRVPLAAGLLADLALADLALADLPLVALPAADLPAAEVPRALLAEDFAWADLLEADLVLAILIPPGSRTSLSRERIPICIRSNPNLQGVCDCLVDASVFG